MSANLYYAPMDKGKCFGGGSSLVEMLRELHGDNLGIFDTSDVNVLRGIAIADKHQRESITELIEAIHRHGQVRVWAEY